MAGVVIERGSQEVRDEEGELLHRLARDVPYTQYIVEIGSYRGRSMAFLAAGSNEGHRTRIFCVDLWTDGIRGGKHPEYADPMTRLAFDENVAKYGHGLVTALQGRSAEIGREFNFPVGLLYVDGAHSFRGVFTDLMTWKKWVPVGGRIVMHDWQLHNVQRAARSAIEIPGDFIREPTPELDRMAVWRRRR